MQSCGPLSAAVAATWIGREGAIIEIGFDPRQRRDQALVADGEADAPAGHRIGLAQRGEFDRDVARAPAPRGSRAAACRRNRSRHRPRRRARRCCDGGRNRRSRRRNRGSTICAVGIGREVEHDAPAAAGMLCVTACLSSRDEIESGADRHMAQRGAGHDEAEGVDRIARVGHQHDIARCGDRLRQVGEPLLRAQGGDDLALGIELDTEAARVIGGIGAPQPGDAARDGIAMRLRVLHRLDQLLDDMRRGRRRRGCPCRDR